MATKKSIFGDDDEGDDWLLLPSKPKQEGDKADLGLFDFHTLKNEQTESLFAKRIESKKANLFTQEDTEIDDTKIDDLDEATEIYYEKALTEGTPKIITTRRIVTLFDDEDGEAPVLATQTAAKIADLEQKIVEQNAELEKALANEKKQEEKVQAEREELTDLVSSLLSKLDVEPSNSTEIDLNNIDFASYAAANVAAPKKGLFE